MYLGGLGIVLGPISITTGCVPGCARECQETELLGEGGWFSKAVNELWV